MITFMVLFAMTQSMGGLMGPALLGTLQMLSGAVAMGVMGFFGSGKPLPMVAGMAAGSLLGLLFTWLTLGGAQPSRHKQPSPETDALQGRRT